MKKYISKIKKCLSCKKNTPKLLLCMVLFAALVYVAIKLIKPLFSLFWKSSKVFKSLQMSSNVFKSLQTSSKVFKRFQKSSNFSFEDF